MGAYVYLGKPGDKFIGDNGKQVFPKCGTVGCIAGWACLLSGNNGFIDAFDPAATLLNLDNPGRLFYEDNWPEPFATQYAKAKRPSQRAKTAAARIEHLITTGE